MSALCIGKHELFDSTDPMDHDLAAKLCAACPLLAECADRAQQLNKQYRAAAYRPLTGTWAGRVYGQDTRSLHPREEALFTDDEARIAHADWCKGIRNDRSRIGERVYQRRKYRQRQARRAVA